MTVDDERKLFSGKIGKIRRLSNDKGLDGIIISSQPNFSWLTGGRGFIGLASENSCASFLITENDIFLFANNIEVCRLVEEEMAAVSGMINAMAFPWYEAGGREKLMESAASKGKYGTDISLMKEFVDLRSSLSPFEIERYRRLGTNSAHVVENVCRNIRREATEFETAGEISGQLWGLGIEPITLLVAFDERISRYRHPLPTANKLGKYAMVSVCARKWGLVVSLTRLVSLGKLSEEIRRKHEAVIMVDAVLTLATRPGEKVKNIFKCAVTAYEKTKYPDEWKKHHQGGLTGYAARENRATPDTEEIVEVNQAYAWNPSITGTKSEDTMIVLENKNEIITHTGDYPCLRSEYGGEMLLTPDILVL